VRRGEEWRRRIDPPTTLWSACWPSWVRVHLLFQRETESLLAVAVFSFQDRQLLTVERTYRDGTHVIVDPTPEEIEIARSGELWDLWNSKRARLLMGMV